VGDDILTGSTEKRSGEHNTVDASEDDTANAGIECEGTSEGCELSRKVSKIEHRRSKIVII